MNGNFITKNRRERSDAPGIKGGSGAVLSDLSLNPVLSLNTVTKTYREQILDGQHGRGAHKQNDDSHNENGLDNENSLDNEKISLPGPSYLVLKRIFDFTVSLVALGIFGLVLPMLALIIKLDSPGSVFFSQERVGLNRRRNRSDEQQSEDNRFSGSERRKVLQPGRPFKVMKLRTMGVNAEADGPQWATKNDIRVTRVGRFLRKTRLDEVPQFINVLRGEMSLIGPRPERLVFVRQLESDIPRYHERLLVLPGITGLAQVLNGYDDCLESVRRKVELDRQYINKSGFRQDGRILLDTVGVVLKGDGAL